MTETPAIQLRDLSPEKIKSWGLGDDEAVMTSSCNDAKVNVRFIDDMPVAVTKAVGGAKEALIVIC